MKFASIGIRAVSLSLPNDKRTSKAGFTLLETLVALTLLVSFAAALEPLLYHARRVFAGGGNGEMRAELQLRSLVQAPFDRANPEIGTREGEDNGMAWRVDVEPYGPPLPSSSGKTIAPRKEISWALYRAKVNVAWGDGRSITAETLQLGRAR